MKTEQPETRKLSGHSTKLLAFGEGPTCMEEPWPSSGLFVGAALGISGQNWPCSNWKMENDNMIPTCRPLGRILQNWAMFSYESMKREKNHRFL